MITGLPRGAIAAQDFDALVDGVRRLGLPVLDLSERTVPELGARIAMAVPEGGSHVERMSPANPGAPLGQSLQRFLDRRGDGLFALAFARRHDADGAGDTDHSGPTIRTLHGARLIVEPAQP